MRTVLRGAFAIVSAVVLVGCASSAPAPSDNPLQQRLVGDVTEAGAFTHLEALQRIADNNGGNRASPGPGYEASVDYVARILRDAGYQVSMPTFRVHDAEVRNVIAQTRTGNPEHVVMAGAHLDSVPEGPGINDNGSGVAALLEIAVRLGGSPEVRNAVRFAWWGSEEAGLVGSTNYVEELSDADRDRIALYLNLDMVASPNPGYLVRGGAGHSSRKSGSDRSTSVARVLVDQLAVAGVTAETIEFEEGASDYEPFVEAGIPSAAALSGDRQVKTAEQAARWGGRADEVFDPCYHKACDRLNNIDATALNRFTHAVAGTVAHFAMSTDGLAR
jgi:aminopeptidase S